MSIVAVYLWSKVMTIQMYTKPSLTVQTLLSTEQVYTKPGMTVQICTTRIDHIHVHKTSFDSANVQKSS